MTRTAINRDRVQRSQDLVQQRRTSRRGSPERSFLDVAELSENSMREILAGGLAVKRHPERFRETLQTRVVSLLFQKTSTRTRVSFEVGVGELGGQPVYIDWRTSNFTLADLEDEIRVLSRYSDLIMARVYRHDDLLLMKRHSEVPIINGLSDRSHPCQALADYMTMLEFFGDLRGLRIAYLGDGNNVCHSLIEGAVRVGGHIAVAHPAGYGPSPEAVRFGEAAGALTLTEHPEEAVREADVVYTDTWVSMGDEAERDVRLKAFSGFQVDAALMRRAPDHALFMHCLPAHRGYEVTSDVLDSANSVVFDQAENRKHVQKYLMMEVLGAA